MYLSKYRVRKLLPFWAKRILRILRQSLGDRFQSGKYLFRKLLRKEPWVFVELDCRQQRLGHGDGSWIVCPDLLSPGCVVYSFGCGDNISFDVDLIQRYNSVVHAFDPTVRSIAWMNGQQLPIGLHFHELGIAAFDGEVEFSLPRGHYVSYSMVPSQSDSTCTGKVKRLRTIMDELGHRSIDLLKLDVEGAEYAVIDDIVDEASRISQLLIEFHHRMVSDAGAAQTLLAIKKLRSAGFKLFSISPRGIEFSFINSNGL
ncbi:FkbM family methyltransferase [Pirellulaceae bacterium SH467]